MNIMEIYRTKVRKVPGTNYKEIYKIAQIIYKTMISNPKRKPYVNSKYFDGQKVFLELFWAHLFDKNQSERLRRLKLFRMGVDLIINSLCSPTVKQNPNNNSEILYRFFGKSVDGDLFLVQIKEV